MAMQQSSQVPVRPVLRLLRRLLGLGVLILACAGVWYVITYSLGVGRGEGVDPGATPGSGSHLYLLVLGIGLFGPWAMLGMDLMMLRDLGSARVDRLLTRAVVLCPILCSLVLLMLGGGGAEIVVGLLLILGLSAGLALAGILPGRASASR